MLKVQDLSKRFATGQVLHQVSFVLNAGEKVGLVGPNGGGKSTLLRIIAGQLPANGGSVRVGPRDRIGYLEQYPERDLDRTVARMLASADRAWDAALADVTSTAAQLADPALQATARDEALEAFAAASARFDDLGGYDAGSRGVQVREGLQLNDLDPLRTVRTLSGGEKTRLALARLLLDDPTILLLDEPTNYLDLPALLWLERWLRASAAAAIVVSHDRRFLDRTVSGILELDAGAHTVTAYPGNFSAYAARKRAEREKHEARYQDQVAREGAARRQIAALKGKAAATETGTVHFHYRKVAKGVARRAKVQERRLERFLASEEKLDRPEAAKGLFLADLKSQAVDDRRLAVVARDLRVAYGAATIVDCVSLAVHGRDRLALIGPNGGGKSTLLRALARAPLPGATLRGEARLGDGVRVGYLAQEHPTPAPGTERSVLAEFRSTVALPEHEARAFLDKFLFTGEAVHRPASELSYGERAKLALATLVGSGANFLLLDEPTSHLDVPALERVEAALAEYPGPFIVASHDRHFLSAIGLTGVLLLDQGALRQLPDLEAYEESERRGTQAGILPPTPPG